MIKLRKHQHKSAIIYTIHAFVVMFYGFAHHASATAPIISQEDLDKAKVLFSGPSEEDYYRTDEMLLSATGSLKPVFFAPSVASVITKEEIEAMGATTLDEVLETVPGLHTSKSAASTFSIIWGIRGIQTRFNPHVLFLLNGIPVTDAFTGSKPQNLNFPISMISRIEVVRGPGSAVHGADAFSGSINIVVLDGQEIAGTTSGVRLGSFGRKDSWIQHGKKYNNWDVSIGIDYLSSNGDSGKTIERDIFGSAGKIDSQFKTLNTHAGLANHQWNAQIWYSRGWDTGGGVGIVNALNNNLDRINTDYLLSSIKYSDENIIKNWLFDFRFDYKYIKKDSFLVLFPPGKTLPVLADGNISFTGTTTNISFPDGVIGRPIRTLNQYAHETTATYTGFAQHKFRFAIGFQYTTADFEATQNFGFPAAGNTIGPINGSLTSVTGTPFIFSPDITRQLFYLSAQNEWTLTRTLELTAGIRSDNYSDFGNTINPRAALVWQARYDFVAKLLYGRAFRAPSIAELNSTNNPVVQKNENLDPETIDTIELVFDYRPTVDSRLSSNFFYYEIMGLIETVEDLNPDPITGATTKTFQNFRDQEAYGVELEASWKINKKLSINGNAAWINATDKTTNKIVPNIPRAQAYGDINYKFRDNWSINGQWFWIRYRARASDDNRPTIDDYQLSHLTLRKKNIFKHINLAFSVKNIFDTLALEPSNSAAELPSDFPLNGREVWLEISAKF